MGWDTIDLIKASVRGWSTSVFYDIPFRHHRIEGKRDGSRTRTWAIQGRASHYLGYRLSYMLVRTAYRAVQEPSAVALMRGYLGAALRREPKCEDIEVRNFIRRSQSLRQLPHADGRGAPSARGARATRVLALRQRLLEPDAANADLRLFDRWIWSKPRLSEPPDHLRLGVARVVLGRQRVEPGQLELPHRSRPDGSQPPCAAGLQPGQTPDRPVDARATGCEAYEKPRAIRSRIGSGSRVTRSASSTSFVNLNGLNRFA